MEDKKKTDEILKNTEEISENTEQIKKTGIKQYNLERYKRVWDALFYTHQRMDVLIISISGGGIYVSLEAIKYLSGKGVTINLCLKLSAIAFVFAIIANFIAQMMSGRIHYFDYQISDIEVTCDEDGTDKKEYKSHLDELNTKIKKFDTYNRIFNWSGITCMSLGLIFLIVFFLITF